MRRRRHVAHNADNDFEVADSSLFLDLWNKLTGAMALLTGVISSIGLLVGGIGVMNIMLISVTERTSEIGIRKAIGARRNDIRAQFLFEAITLSGIGGIIGILIGGFFSLMVRTFAHIPSTVSPFWVVAGVAMSVSVGLFFGYYPPTAAGTRAPFVCWRYEYPTTIHRFVTSYEPRASASGCTVATTIRSLTVAARNWKKPGDIARVSPHFFTPSHGRGWRRDRERL